MTRKQKKQVKIVTVQSKQPKKKATPFADAGQIIGSKASTLFGAPWAKGVGRWLGSGIGQIFGSGDYTMAGPAPSYNVLTNGNQIPKFETGKQTNIICHREYLGDILGGPGFSLSSYPLNPGMSKTFPWLSTVAQNYQEFRFHGLIFEFRSLTTDFVAAGAPGAIIMATNYNADGPLFTNKQEMETSEFAMSAKPTRDLIHGIECAGTQTILPQRYVRSGELAVGRDKQLYDYGNFQIAAKDNPAMTLGELWVSYCVEFLKPILPVDIGGNIKSSHAVRATFNNANPLGTIGYSLKSDNGFVCNATTFFDFEAEEGNYYLLTITWIGTVAAAVVLPSFTYTGAVQQNFWTTGATQYAQSPDNGVNSTRLSYQTVIRAAGLNTFKMIEVTLGTAGTLPTGTTSVDIVITPMSTETVI